MSKMADFIVSYMHHQLTQTDVLKKSFIVTVLHKHAVLFGH